MMCYFASGGSLMVDSASDDYSTSFVVRQLRSPSGFVRTVREPRRLAFKQTDAQHQFSDMRPRCCYHLWLWVLHVYAIWRDRCSRRSFQKSNVWPQLSESHSHLHQELIGWNANANAAATMNIVCDDGPRRAYNPPKQCAL
jgi:hypothetical protein